MTDEQQLTAQEICEADALVALWKNFGEKDSQSLRLIRDVEEILGKCYGSVKDFSLGPGNVLRDTVNSATQIIAEAKSCKDDIENFCNKNGITMGVGTPPAWFDQRCGTFIERLMIITEQSRKALPVVDMMAKAAATNPAPMTEALPVLEEVVKKLEIAEALWRSVQKDSREKLAKILENFGSGRRSIRRTIEIWAQVSEARVAYLQSKGMHVAPVVNCLASKPAQVLKPVKAVSARRQKKEVAVAAISNGKPKEAVVPEKPWKIYCVHYSGNVYNELELLLLSDNGQALAKTLEDHSRWAPDGKRTIEALRRFVNMPAKDRHTVGSYKLWDEKWYRIKVGKYRMLANVKDADHAIYLMADHKTEVMAGIGRNKNES